MQRLLVWVLFAFLSVSMIAGCGKKTTKVDTSPERQVETPAEEVEEEETPVFTPSDEDVFETVDMDAAAREVLVPVYFEYDQYQLSPEAIDKLEKIAAFLSENKSVRLLIEGHADERGTNEYNIGLGENRAKAAKNYLTSYGIASVRLETTSYGRERPAIENCPDEACHARNRRVEWQILAK